MFAIANEGVDPGISDPGVQALQVGTREALSVDALRCSPATFHLTPGSHRRRHWLSARQGRGGQTTGRAMVRGAGLEETLDQRSSPRNLRMRKLKTEPVQAPKQREREEKEAHEQNQENVESHTIPRRLKYETCRDS
jgi:hypothetical protein